jgi:hypothetical protein
MTDPDEAFLEAKVTRYRIGRIRLGQLLVPLAVIVSVFARRVPTTLSILLAFALQGIALAVFLSAMKGFGWQPLRFGDGGVSFGETGLRLLRREVRRWTLIGRIARLYGGEVSFKLQVGEGSETVLGALLQSQFGSPLVMERRGSTRARLVALFAALAGVVLCTFAIARDSALLALLGAPAMVLGLAMFGAMSQRVARR